MAKIEGFRVKNYRSLKEVSLGWLWQQEKSVPLTPLTAVIGKNGSGKSSLFDAFGFLADCLKLGVEEACDARGRGGFNALRSQGETGAIEFEVTYRESEATAPVIYMIFINLDKSNRPFVVKEILCQYHEEKTSYQHGYFLVLSHGKGVVWKGEQGEGLNLDQLAKVFQDKRRLGSHRWVVIEGKVLSWMTNVNWVSPPLAH